jgi:hypothetical protein
MKRFHVHVAVNSLDESVQFYSKVFGAEPSVLKADYAKWMLDDPRLNFAISHRGQVPGINHLGFQAEDDVELEAIHTNLQSAGTAVIPEKGASCCYAKSDKYWITDPQGIAWESFRSLGSIPLFGSDGNVEEAASCGSGDAASSGCCPEPQTEKAKSCCN